MINLVVWSLLTLALYLGLRKFLSNLKNAILNPILVTILILIVILITTKTDYAIYKEATSWITYLLGPVVVMLAVPLYKNRLALIADFKAISIGILSSILGSLGLVILLSKMFNLSKEMLLSLLPKSITTPMAIEVTEILGGQEGLTIVFVILTGILGATFAPFTLKVFKIKSPLAKGIGIGASSHGIGTSKAVELGDEVAAASGLAMGVAGVSTVIFYSIIVNLL